MSVSVLTSVRSPSLPVSATTVAVAEGRASVVRAVPCFGAATGGTGGGVAGMLTVARAGVLDERVVTVLLARRSARSTTVRCVQDSGQCGCCQGSVQDGAFMRAVCNGASTSLMQ